MRHDDINAAYAAKAIDAITRAELRVWLHFVSQQDVDSPFHALSARVHVVQQPWPPSDAQRHTVESLRGAACRPGLMRLFEHVHAGALENVADEDELRSVDTFLQIDSIVRAETQFVLARAIRGVWKPMLDSFERRRVLIPYGPTELRAPADCEVVVMDGVSLACVPLDEDFGRRFGAATADQTLALLRRSVERMSTHAAGVWARSDEARTPEARGADELLRKTRGLDICRAIANGVGSGILDVVNPLHALVLDLLERHGREFFTGDALRKILETHVDFSVILANFSLPCLIELENVMREPARAETLAFLRGWTNHTPDMADKGHALDCNYGRRFFTTRILEDGTPVADINFEAFSGAELASIQCRALRLGCPSLGQPHRQFTRAVSQAYFDVVLPRMLQEE